LVDAPPLPAVVAAPAPTWVPAVGGCTVVAFFGQPANRAAPASIKATDTILFI
jgi:hypothetical protein